MGLFEWLLLGELFMIASLLSATLLFIWKKLGIVGEVAMSNIEETFLNEIDSALEDNKIKLTSWEEDFLDSIREQTYDPTKKQRETIDRIHSKISSW